MITDQLYVSSKMGEKHFKDLGSFAFKLIISMIGQNRHSLRERKDSYEVLWLKSFDSFLTPIPMKTLEKGVISALPFLDKGQKVLVYCRQGKRRSVTMAASILIAQGYTSDQAMKLLKEKRPVSSPMLWYVQSRIRKFEQFWTNSKESRKS